MVYIFLFFFFGVAVFSIACSERAAEAATARLAGAPPNGAGAGWRRANGGRRRVKSYYRSPFTR